MVGSFADSGVTADSEWCDRECVMMDGVCCCSALLALAGRVVFKERGCEAGIGDGRPPDSELFLLLLLIIDGVAVNESTFFDER